MTTGNRRLDATIAVTDAALKQHAAMPSALETLLAKRRATPAMTPPKPLAAKPILTKGMTPGRIAGVVAAVAVVGGGIYLATRKKPEREENWTQRVQQERQQAGLAR